MCTVSFVPTSNGILITSNRDEQSLRPPASAPKRFRQGSSELYYPVDGKANGTWFIVRNDGSTGVLLNGGFRPHVPEPLYPISRGAVLPSIFSAGHPVVAIQAMDLKGLENFTLLIYYQDTLHECRWDGGKLFVRRLDAARAYIYSSVTLYDPSMARAREGWFNEWLCSNPSPIQEEAIRFHEMAGAGNPHFGLCMKRDNGMHTVSITSVSLQDGHASLYYRDCTTQLVSQLRIECSQQPIPNIDEA